MVKTEDTYTTVLNIVQRWTPEQKLTLIQEILRTLQTDLSKHYQRPPHDTLPLALGLLTSNMPAPSDAEIQNWLDEHRMEKYG